MCALRVLFVDDEADFRETIIKRMQKRRAQTEGRILVDRGDLGQLRSLELLGHHVTPSMIRRINLQYGFGPLLYVGAIGVAGLSAVASMILDVAFAVFFTLPAFTISDAGVARRHDVSADEDAGFASG